MANEGRRADIRPGMLFLLGVAAGSGARGILAARLGAKVLGTEKSPGDSNPQQRISKRGDEMIRRLMVNCAQYLLGPFAQDSDLRRHGEKIAERGGKNAKKRAMVAVARKLSVLLHRLWITGEVYEPLYNANHA